jgi:hypothetical protein
MQRVILASWIPPAQRLGYPRKRVNSTPWVGPTLSVGLEGRVPGVSPEISAPDSDVFLGVGVKVLAGLELQLNLSEVGRRLIDRNSPMILCWKSHWSVSECRSEVVGGILAVLGYPAVYVAGRPVVGLSGLVFALIGAALPPLVVLGIRKLRRR